MSKTALLLEGKIMWLYIHDVLSLISEYVTVFAKIDLVHTITNICRNTTLK